MFHVIVLGGIGLVAPALSAAACGGVTTEALRGDDAGLKGGHDGGVGADAFPNETCACDQDAFPSELGPPVADAFPSETVTPAPDAFPTEGPVDLDAGPPVEDAFPSETFAPPPDAFPSEGPVEVDAAPPVEDAFPVEGPIEIDAAAPPPTEDADCFPEETAMARDAAGCK